MGLIMADKLSDVFQLSGSFWRNDGGGVSGGVKIHLARGPCHIVPPHPLNHTPSKTCSFRQSLVLDLSGSLKTLKK